MATRPNEIVSEAMERALLGGMKQRYSIAVRASTVLLTAAFQQVIEANGIFSIL